MHKIPWNDVDIFISFHTMIPIIILIELLLFQLMEYNIDQVYPTQFYTELFIVLLGMCVLRVLNNFLIYSIALSWEESYCNIS